MNESNTRRDLLKYGVAAAASAALGDLSLRGQSAATQRTVIIMFDGFGPGYLAESKPSQSTLSSGQSNA
ncbi:MAG: hypothetical protein DMG17_26980 [Acidobacteria bacterium]|nr:MAG: hypothetical protein DMG17_26980 [Acidobacteriota bacterium]